MNYTIVELEFFKIFNIHLFVLIYMYIFGAEFFKQTLPLKLNK